MEAPEETSKPTITVTAASRVSPNLFAIKDPLAEAVEARWNGNDELAYKKFYAAWLASPESEGVVIGLADMALKTGRAKDAYHAISNLKGGLEKENPSLLAVQVLAEIAVGKSPDVQGRLTHALEKAPNDPRLWNALGRFHDSKGQWLQAQDCYIKSLKRGGSKAGLNNNLGMSLLMQGRTLAALSKFEQAVETDEENELFDNNRRLTLAVMGRYDEATDGMSHSRAADILNDAGYVAKISQQNTRAKALFKAAIEQSLTYHSKAHGNMNNLQHK